jgi:hypothetical protein
MTFLILFTYEKEVYYFVVIMIDGIATNLPDKGRTDS